MTDDPLAERIPEDRVATILARAAELDRSTRETVDTHVIRGAALEAGISPAAVDRALEEYAKGRGTDDAAVARDGAPRERSRWRRWGRKLVRPLALGIGALVLGILTAEAEALLVLLPLVWLAYAARLAWRSRPARRARRYLVTMAALGGGGFFGFIAANGDEDAAVFVFFFALALMAVGSLVIKVGRREPNAAAIAERSA